VPIVIDSPRVDRLRPLVPLARVTPQPGVAGWNVAVLAVLEEG
jgi:hypothetical protein